MTTIDPAIQSFINGLAAHVRERTGLRQAEPMARLRRRVRVAPVALLIELEQACFALEMGQRRARSL